jgi:hypothetical protein
MCTACAIVIFILAANALVLTAAVLRALHHGDRGAPL